MTDLPLTGGCNCGAVHYEVTEPLIAAAYCHCTRCQRRSGTAAGAVGRPAPGTFHVVKGEDRLKCWAPEHGGQRWFCSDCGSPILGRDPSDADQMVIHLGTLDTDPGIRPSLHLYVTYACRWEAVEDDGMPRFPEGLGQPAAAAPEARGPVAVVSALDLKGESAEITNEGDAPLDLGGWKLHDDSKGKPYTFPAGTVLAAGASVRVRSGPGAAKPAAGELAWKTASVWSDRGDTAFLEDAAGTLVSSRKG
jgi:hypothetical protein